MSLESFKDHKQSLAPTLTVNKVDKAHAAALAAHWVCLHTAAARRGRLRQGSKEDSDSGKDSGGARTQARLKLSGRRRLRKILGRGSGSEKAQTQGETQLRL